MKSDVASQSESSCETPVAGPTAAEQVPITFALFNAINSQTDGPLDSSVCDLDLTFLDTPIHSPAGDIFRNFSDYSDDM